MEWVVTSGATIEAATEIALDELGIDIDEAEIEVLEQPRAGLFGIHSRDARIRARVAPTAPRPKVERRDRRRRSGSDDRKADDGKGRGRSSSKKEAASTTADAAPDEKPAEPKPARKRTRKSAARKDDAPGTTEAAGEDAGEDAGTDQSTPSEPKPARKRSRKRAAPKDEAPAVEATEPAAPEPARKRSRKKPDSTPPTAASSNDLSSPDDATTEPTQQGASMTSISIEDQVEVIEDFLDGLMEAFDLDGEIATFAIDDETSEVRVDGDELGYLIGPKGQTLAAVHELCRTVAQRRLAGPHEGRIRLDIGGYRERRRVALARFATQVAEDVRSSGVEKALEPMSPPDRKVVHDTINEIDGVSTSSEGEEPRRRVVVSPTD